MPIRQLVRFIGDLLLIFILFSTKKSDCNYLNNSKVRVKLKYNGRQIGLPIGSELCAHLDAV